ncbi:hypothetical protein D3C72_2360780 [compost metagenome]
MSWSKQIGPAKSSPICGVAQARGARCLRPVAKMAAKTSMIAPTEMGPALSDTSMMTPVAPEPAALPIA